MILVIVAYVAINVVIQSFIQPKFLGDAVGLSTTVTFLSLILWAFVLGPLGALLAIPLSLLTRALLVDSDPGAEWAAAAAVRRSARRAAAGGLRVGRPGRRQKEAQDQRPGIRRLGRRPPPRPGRRSAPPAPPAAAAAGRPTVPPRAACVRRHRQGAPQASARPRAVGRAVPGSRADRPARRPAASRVRRSPPVRRRSSWAPPPDRRGRPSVGPPPAPGHRRHEDRQQDDRALRPRRVQRRPQLGGTASGTCSRRPAHSEQPRIAGQANRVGRATRNGMNHMRYCAPSRGVTTMNASSIAVVEVDRVGLAPQDQHDEQRGVDHVLADTGETGVERPVCRRRRSRSSPTRR